MSTTCMYTSDSKLIHYSKIKMQKPTHTYSLSPVAKASIRLFLPGIEIVIPSLSLGIAKRVAHATVSLYEGCISAKYKCSSRHVRIVPASVSDEAHIFYHRNTETRFNLLLSRRIDKIYCKAIKWFPFIINASDR